MACQLRNARSMVPTSSAQNRTRTGKELLGEQDGGGRAEVPRPEQRRGHTRASSHSAAAESAAVGTTSIGACAAERGSTSPITAAAA